MAIPFFLLPPPSKLLTIAKKNPKILLVSWLLLCLQGYDWPLIFQRNAEGPTHRPPTNVFITVFINACTQYLEDVYWVQENGAIMAYELFARTSVRVEDPSLSLVPDGRIALNAAAVRILKEAGVKFVLLLWDKVSNKIALKAAPKTDKNSYAVSIGRDSHSGSLRAKSFLAHVGWSATKRTMLPATWDEKDKMFEITLPQELVRAAVRGDTNRKAKKV